MAERKPELVMIIGPAAVGKMAVGLEVAARTGLKLFHNHQTIDLVLQYFAFGTAPFWRLVSLFRRRIMEEVADSDLPGLIFTYVWAFDVPGDEREVESYVSIFRERGGRVSFVELQAPQSVRLERNVTPLRLQHKAPKRDLELSRRNLIEMDTKYELDSGDRFAGREDWLKIDNTSLSPAEVAETIITRFELPRAGSGQDLAGR